MTWRAHRIITEKLPSRKELMVGEETGGRLVNLEHLLPASRSLLSAEQGNSGTRFCCVFIFDRFLARFLIFAFPFTNLGSMCSLSMFVL